MDKYVLLLLSVFSTGLGKHISLLWNSNFNVLQYKPLYSTSNYFGLIFARKTVLNVNNICHLELKKRE